MWFVIFILIFAVIYLLTLACQQGLKISQVFRELDAMRREMDKDQLFLIKQIRQTEKKVDNKKE